MIHDEITDPRAVHNLSLIMRSTAFENDLLTFPSLFYKRGYFEKQCGFPKNGFLNRRLLPFVVVDFETETVVGVVK